MTNPHMQRAVQVGAASIDYWLCENDKAIELSFEIRDMFREGLEAALPHIREMIAKEIRDHTYRNMGGPGEDYLYQAAMQDAARIAKGLEQ